MRLIFLRITVTTNFKTKLGEIDIIARDRDILSFIEVKTRRNESFSVPAEAVGRLKQRKISQIALIFLKQKKLLNYKARFDVVTISIIDKQPKIELIKNAFELDNSYLY